MLDDEASVASWYTREVCAACDPEAVKVTPMRDGVWFVSCRTAGRGGCLGAIVAPPDEFLLGAPAWPMTHHLERFDAGERTAR